LIISFSARVDLVQGALVKFSSETPSPFFSCPNADVNIFRNTSGLGGCGSGSGSDRGRSSWSSSSSSRSRNRGNRLRIIIEFFEGKDFKLLVVTIGTFPILEETTTGVFDTSIVSGIYDTEPGSFDVLEIVVLSIA